jgi:hypothetical protein
MHRSDRQACKILQRCTDFALLPCHTGRRYRYF